MNLSNYLKDVVKELKLSTFPTQNTVINFTLFVLIFTAVMAAFLGLLDLIFGGAILKAVEALRVGAGNANTLAPVVDPVVESINNATNTIVQ